MVRDQYALYLETLEPLLSAAGIKRLRLPDLSGHQRSHVNSLFDDEIASVIAPTALDGETEFPLLPSLQLNLCIRFRGGSLVPRDASEEADNDGERYAIIPFGRSTPRFYWLRDQGYLLLEDIVAHYADRMFPKAEILECVPFRITRNADLAVREDSAGDLMEQMERVLDERREADCARLEVSAEMTPKMQSYLTARLEVLGEDIYSLTGPLDLAAFFAIADRKGFDELRYPPKPPLPSLVLPEGQSVFDVIRERDLLLHHPYESFEPVVRLIQEAARDPDVLAIKQTLYRTSRQSAIVEALADAAESGKNVTVLVELKARFDEERNIEWARRLEQAGAQVIYGVRGLKTHAKLCVVVRRESDGIQRYVHFGTGNYNESTARVYTDVSLFTRDPDLSSDAVNLFNAIAGYSIPQPLRKLAMAPLDLRERVLALIRGETARKQQGQPARIMAKINSLVDPKIIDALYEASRAGVPIQLNVRGICCLRPGVEGLSETIEVVSIIDRFLEHSRILYFHHGGDQQVYISSADWMPRNLDQRIELLVPVEDDACRRRLIDVLETCLGDNVKGRRILPDGKHRRPKKKPAKPVRAQEVFYEQVAEKVALANRQQRTTFEPHLSDENGA
jgi:polyphosphate kinase